MQHFLILLRHDKMMFRSVDVPSAADTADMMERYGE